VSSLETEEDADPADLIDIHGQRTAKAERAVDRLREKFGRGAVVKGLAMDDEDD
jgi:DNA polymerase-4